MHRKFGLTQIIFHNSNEFYAKKASLQRDDATR